MPEQTERPRRRLLSALQTTVQAELLRSRTWGDIFLQSLLAAPSLLPLTFALLLAVTAIVAYDAPLFGHASDEGADEGGGGDRSSSSSSSASWSESRLLEYACVVFALGVCNLYVAVGDATSWSRF